MDRQIEGKSKVEAQQPSKSTHLMCRTPLWGVAGVLACGYFVWISFGHVFRNEYDWPHDTWTVATYIVWVVLLAGIMLETRCLRERAFFGVLVLNFVIGLTLTLWQTVPATQIRTARLGTGVLWALGALISLTTLGRANAKSEEKQA
jgi:hypothetical protein